MQHPVRRLLWIIALVLCLSLLTAGHLPESEPAAPGPPTAESLWGAGRPTGVATDRDTKSVELGTRFTTSQAGRALGVRFWKNPKNTGPHVGNLWSDDGTRLGSARFTQESESGWQVALFNRPVTMRAGQEYVVSYFAPNGRYSATQNFQGTSVTDSLAVTPGETGLYTYGPRSSLPESSWRSSQYWVDVLFEPTAASVPMPPVLPPGPAPGRQQNCAPQPSACGYPDASNTGPPAGARLVKVPQERTSGPGWTYQRKYQRVLVTEPNASLDHLDIVGGVVIDAPDVTVSNSRIRTCGSASETDVVAIRVRPEDGYRGTGARVLNNVLDGLPPGCDYRARSGVRDIYGAATAVVVDGNDVSGTSNGITIEYEGLIQDNWIHDLGHVFGDHHSGISTHGGSKQVTMRHNTVLLGHEQLSGNGGVSGAITNYADFAHSQNVTVDDNLMSGGAYTVYGGNSGNEYSTPSTNIKIRNNRFVCGEWAYGPVAMFQADSPGNAWGNNVCDRDGRNVKP